MKRIFYATWPALISLIGAATWGYCFIWWTVQTGLATVAFIIVGSISMACYGSIRNRWERHNSLKF